MPRIQAPVDAAGGFFGDPGARLVLHDENVVGMLIGRRSDVGVVKIRRVLEAEEETHVAVAVFFAGLDEIGFEDEVAKHSVRNQRDVERRTDGGRVLALLNQFQCAAFFRRPFPGRGIGHDELGQRRLVIEALFV